MLSGKITHHLEGGCAKLSGGDVFIVPPNLPHYIDANDGAVDFYAMSFMPDFFLGIGESNKLITDLLYYLKTAALEFSGDNIGKDEVIRECVSVLLSLFARIYFEEKAESLRLEYNRSSVLHCNEYIKNHPDEDLSLSEIARRSAMSKTCFCSIFSSITGTTIKHFYVISCFGKCITIYDNFCCICNFQNTTHIQSSLSESASKNPLHQNTDFQE